MRQDRSQRSIRRARHRRGRFEWLEPRRVLSSITGFKWHDLNGNGVRDTDLLSGERPAVVFVVDVSSSTNSSFGGSAVGNVNGDSRSDTILDAELAGFLALNQRLVDLGFGDIADVAITVFGTRAAGLDMNPLADGVQLATSPLADTDSNGIRDVEDVLRTIRVGHQGIGSSTSFDEGLSTTIDTLNSLGTIRGEGNMVFLSDGANNGGPFLDEVDTLRDAAVNLRAFGVGTGSSLTQLRQIDPRAAIFTSTDELLNIFSGGANNDGVTFTEPGVANWTIFLDTNNNGLLDSDELSTTTDAQGDYAFNGLANGEYTVAEQPRDGWIQVFPGAAASGRHAVTISDGEPVDRIHFGNQQRFSVSGVVYHDRNRSASLDLADPALAGWTVFLDTNADAAHQAGEPIATTDARGIYRFDDLERGDYVVRVAVREGWDPLDPDDAARAVSLTGTSDVSGINFGLAEPPAPRVISVQPGVQAAIGSGVQHVRIEFDGTLDPATRWAPSFGLLASGGDRRFSEGNEIEIPIDDVVWSEVDHTVTLELAAFLPRDSYRLTVLDDVMNPYGARLDGDLRGQLPSGDGEDGGDFVSYFHVTNAPPVAAPQELSTLQTDPLVIQLDGSDAEGDALQFRVVFGPGHGTLTPGATSADWTYTPDPLYQGRDTISFVASDGTAEGLPADIVISVAAAPTDLHPLTFSVSEPSGAFGLGDSITLQWSGRNEGPGSTIDWSPDWSDAIYLSRDGVLDEDDVLVGSWDAHLPALAAGGSYAAELTLELPVEPEWSGSAFLIVDVDVSHRQLDTDFENNQLAMPIQLTPGVELVDPYVGKFVDGRTPISIGWRDIASDFSGEVRLFIDMDSDPTNQLNHQVLVTGLNEDTDGAAGDRRNVRLPTLSPGTYYLFAALLEPDTANIWYSDPLPVRMVDIAYADPESLQDAVGGSAYEVREVELGRVGDEFLYRVRTNYNPQARGGDLYLNVDGSFETGTGTIMGIAVNDRTTSSGARVTAGNLYRGATFDQGLVVEEHPTFIRDPGTEVTGQSVMQVTATPARDWDYEINGSFALAAVDPTGNASLELAWAMYCGNDLGVTRTEDPPTAPDLTGERFQVIGDTPDQIHQWGDTITVDLAIANIGNGDATASQVSIFLSEDGEITPDDTVLRANLGVPPIQAGELYAVPVVVTLPATPPADFETTCGVTIGMIVDVQAQVAESDETNNRNMGEGRDLARTVIGGLLEDEGIDVWYATKSPNSSQLESQAVTWTVCIGVAGPHSLRIHIDSAADPGNAGASWSLGAGSDSAGPQVNIENVYLGAGQRSVPLSTAGFADLGRLETGTHRFTIDAFHVPARGIVEEVDLRLYHESNLLGTHEIERHDALFIADHARNDSYDALAARYAPILHFTHGERFHQPYDAAAVYTRYADRDVRSQGSRNDALNLGDFAPGGANPGLGSAVVHAAVLPGQALGDPAYANQLAINYYVHYPRSDWQETGGGTNTHEGDWEGVTLFFQWENGDWQPYQMAFAQHIRFGSSPGGVTVPWDRLNRLLDADGRQGDRTHVFVGLGGHATYPGPGETQWAFDSEVHNGDFAAAQGRETDRNVQVDLLNRAGDDDAPEWLLYPGYWGVQGLGEGCTFGAFGRSGPRGPMYLSCGFDPGQRWLNPWQWAAGFHRPNTIGSLAGVPSNVSQPDNLTLVATSLATPNSPDPQVRFYHETNGISGLQLGVNGDRYLGVDEDGDDGWSLVVSTADLANGAHTYYASASEAGVTVLGEVLREPTLIGPYAMAPITAIGQPPVADNDQFAVDEDEALEITWDQLFANDSDPDSPYGEWVISEVGAEVGGVASIDAAARRVSFVPELDYHGTARFEYTLFDGLGSTNTATVTVDVAAVNDPPRALEVVVAPVRENQGGIVGTVQFYDPDGGDEHRFTVSDDRFEVVDGQLALAPDRTLDYEEAVSLTFEIEVFDDGRPPLSTVRSVTVDVIDVNESEPAVDDQEFEIIEGSSAPQVVGQVAASDADHRQTLTYALAGDGPFVIDAQSGLITVAGEEPLDAETENRYELSVTVTDSGVPPLETEATLVVTIGDVNEFAPAIPTQTLHVAENASAAHVVGTVNVIDDDAAPDFHFEIVGANPDGAFAIDPVTGEITVANPLPLDFERRASVTPIVRVTDRVAPVQSIDGFVTIVIDDVNEFTPTMDDQAFSVAENFPSGISLGTLQAGDQDRLSTLRYTILASTAPGIEVDAVTGDLTVAENASLDHEAIDRYVLTVEVADSGTPPRMAVAEVTVDVRDVNEFAPTLVPQSFSLEENSPAETMVGRVEASDGDIRQTLAFEAIGGDTGLLEVDRQTGDLRFVGQQALDFETLADPNLHLLVRVSDSASQQRSTSAQMTVRVGDVNERPVLVESLVDQTSHAYVPLGFALPFGAFRDEDAGDVLTIRAELTDGSPLPGWLRFDAPTMAFTGNPTDAEAGTWGVRVVAEDLGQPPLSAADTFELAVVAATWQNPVNVMDVNQDGFVTPNDVLVVINEINHPGSSDASGRLLDTYLPDQPRYDVNNDGFATPRDILIVINFLNGAGGEGESALAVGVTLTSLEPTAAARHGQNELASNGVTPTLRWSVAAGDGHWPIPTSAPDLVRQAGRTPAAAGRDAAERLEDALRSLDSVLLLLAEDVAQAISDRQ